MRVATPILLLLALTLSGCVAQTGVPVDIASAALPPTATGLVARLWLNNWVTTASNLTIDYDPEMRFMKAEGVLTIRNELGQDRPWVNFFLGNYKVTRLEDGDGNKIDFKIAGLDANTGLTPDELDYLIDAAITINATLSGDVSHGSEKGIRIAYEGWSSDHKMLVGVPNEFSANYHGLNPVTTGYRTKTDNWFTITHPAEWIVLAAAEPKTTVEAGGRVTTTYWINEPRAAVYSAKGLEFHRDVVDGVEVKTFFTPDMRVQGAVAHDVTKRVIRVMPQFTGPYPYSHIWTVPHQVPANAFSTPGLTFMGINFYRFHVPNAPYQFGRFTPYVGGQDGFEMVLVHEHTHNWWGHSVRGNNTNPQMGPIDTWMSEGLTTYLSELVWFDTQYGEEDGAASARGKVADQIVNKLLDQKETGAAQQGGDAYEKTGVAMRALEAYAIATGRPHAVFDALKLGQATYGRTAGGEGQATSHQMFKVFSDAFGEDLMWHFEPWFLGGDVPDFSVKSVTRSDDNLTVSVGNGAVKAGVQIRAYSASGREVTGWGVAEKATTTPVSLKVPESFGMEPIVRVELDPLQYVYEVNETDNVWVGQA